MESISQLCYNSLNVDKYMLYVGCNYYSCIFDKAKTAIE